MTDMGRPRGAAGPPWTIDQLAELHAGALSDAEAARLWPQVQADPEAQAVLSALDATVADLGAFAEAPVAPMPADVAARLDAALAAEAARGVQPTGQPQGLAPVVDMAAARRKRNRQLGWGLGLVSAAAAAVAVVAVVSPGSSTPGTPMADPDDSAGQPPSAGAPLAVSPEQPEAAFGEVNGVHDYGQLRSREGLDACLQAHGLPTDGNTAGIRPVTIDGKDAVLAVLTTGELATYRIIAVSPDCSADNPGNVYVDKVFGKGAGN